MRYQTYGSSSDTAIGMLLFIGDFILAAAFMYLLQPIADYLYDSTSIQKDVIDWVGGITLFILSTYLSYSIYVNFSDLHEVKNDLKQWKNFGPAQALLGFLHVLWVPLLTFGVLVCAVIKYLSINV